MIYLVLLLVSLLVPSLGEAASCTFGTDCYCDKVVPSGGSLYDASLLVCEDFEAPTLHDDVGFGTTGADARGTGGTDAYGPWYDYTGNASSHRGANQYMNRTYVNGSNAGTWEDGEPGSLYGSTTVGNNCGAGLVCWPGEYRLDDRWQANDKDLQDGGACVDVIKTGSSNANDEDSALGIPDTFGTNDQRGVWDGNQTFGYRIRATAGETQQEKWTCGIVATAPFTNVTEIGLTMGIAYSDTAATLNAIADSQPLKHEEFGHSSDPTSQEFLLGNTGLREVAGFPFAPFMFSSSQSACNSAVSGATLIKGQLGCSSTALQIGTNLSEYTQSTDWPFGKWGCVRIHKKGMGTSNMEFHVWFGNGTTETLVFSMTGFNGASALKNQSYNFFIWNSYANANSPSLGYGGFDKNFRRWIDNYHLRNGAPVSCSQIGFDGSGGGGGSSSYRKGQGGSRFSAGTKINYEVPQ